MGGGKGGSPKQRVTEYYMSIHFGVCQGPVDALTRIRVNEKTAYEAIQSQQGTILINNEGLFGGVKKEGGVKGNVYWQPGNFTQKLHSYVAAKLGLTPDTAPGYRGIATAWFTEASISARNGFYWSANSPFVPPVDFRVTRIPSVWYLEKAPIYDPLGGARSVYFLLDRSASLSASEFSAIKNAVLSSLDEIENYVSFTGERVDVGVRFYSAGSTAIERTNVSVSDLDDIRSFINSAGIVTGGDVLSAMEFVEDWFTATVGQSFDKRALIFVTDTNSEDGMTAAAAGPAADMLDQSSGTFSGDTKVDMYAINFSSTTTTWTSLLDNTPDDGIPVIDGTDASGLILAVRRALFASDLIDVNPAHIIYECLTNTAWGMGAPSSLIDDTSFRAAADVFANEFFGLSMIWVKQSTIESIVQEVLDHVEATLYVDASTGKFKLKPLRDDYDPDALPVLDESNSTVTSHTRRSPAEIINEINVTWTNPENEQEEVVTIQDLGGIVQSGGQIISDNRNYYGVRRQSLAWRIAQRDIAAASARLSTGVIEVDRSAWDFRPGDPFKLTSSEHGLDEEIMRVVKINPGKPGDSSIVINYSQDIYSFQRPSYEQPPDTEIEDQEQQPEPFDSSVLFTLNYFLAVNRVQGLLGVEYPDTWVGILQSTDNTDAQEYELIGELTDAAGNVSLQPLGTKTITAQGLLSGNFAQEAQTVTTGFSSLSVGSGPQVGGFALIGDAGTAQEDMEIVLFVSYSAPNWTVRRGVLDTVPKAWPSGTEIRFLAADAAVVDQNVRSDGEELDYQALMRTSLGLLSGASAPILTYTATDRPYLPSRPADVTIEGTSWGNVDASALSTVDCTWANRNRVEEDTQVLAWDDTTITPEVGQTTVIEFYDASDGSLYNSITVPEGDTSYSIPIAQFTVGVTDLKFVSERDGFTSLTGHTRRVITSSGYGNAYGLDYGGDF